MTRLTTSCLLLVALAVTALADGMVVPKAAIVRPVRTPDQKALLRFDGTTETLVIETTLEGEGREFAWLLPLPSTPKIEPSTTGLFPTLSAMCAPTVEDGERDGPDPTWILVVAAGLGLWTSVRWWRRPLPPVIALLVPPALLCAAGVLFGWGPKPIFLKGGSGPESVTVISREQVGVFDTAVLDARDAVGLRAWLDANGFGAPAGIDPVVDAYAKEGWVFVASKIRRDVDDLAVRRIHPLAFTFTTPRAVYPMRLTGAANDTLALELFVAGDRRAEVAGLTVEVCFETSNWTAVTTPHMRPPDFERFDDDDSPDEVSRRCAGATVLTKLTGFLDREAMTRDLDVTWVDYVRTKVVYLTSDEALRRSLLRGAWAFAAGLLLAAVVGRMRAVAAGVVATPHDIAWPTAALLAGAALTTYAWFQAPRLPAEAVIVGPWDGPDLTELLREPPKSVRGDAAAVRAWARSVTSGCTNPVTGESVREEDSPGNWSLRDADGRIELVVHELSSTQSAIDLSRLASIEGTVWDADNRVVEGASVRFTDTYWRPAPGEFFTYTVRAETDWRGHYHLEVPIGRSWHVSVAHREHPYLLRQDVDLRDPPATPMNLRLPRERTIRGRVVDASGRPVAGVIVHGARESPFQTHDAGHDSSATTAADGTFALTGFDADAASIRVSLHVHQAEHCRALESKTVEFRPDSEPVELLAPK